MATILIVDDIPENVQLLTFALEDDGYNVATAINGRECLEKAQSLKPELILLDIMMPVMDGMQTLQKLKSDPQLKPIPVIMVSANDDEERVISTLDVGAHDFVSKPINYSILAARMRSALRLREAQRQLTRLNHDLARLASIDPLTGVYNRRHYFGCAETEFEKSKRYSRPLSVIMLDVDHFKSINDQYGHNMGDTVLVELCRICSLLIRSSDFIGRLGGEEFAIVCPETDLEGASHLAERIRQTIHDTTIGNDEVAIHVSVSIGVAELDPDDENIEILQDRADQLLYQAKKLGRNQVISVAARI